eukprot:362247-Rhodomonas_salina.3
MVIVEEVGAEGINVRHTDTMVVAVEEVEKAVVQGKVEVVGWWCTSGRERSAECFEDGCEA